MKNMRLVVAVAAAMALSAIPFETDAQLLAGTAANPNTLSGGGIIYAYQGGTNWTAISPSLGYAVLDIISFNGTLYAATEASNDTGSGSVWRYNGGASWSVVETNMDNAVCTLAIYKGQLYAGAFSYADVGTLYRYNGTNFDIIAAGTGNPLQPPLDFSGYRSMYSSSFGYLQLGDILADVFGHYDGTNIYEDADFADSCVLDFATFNNKLYAASEEPAILFGSTNGTNWSSVTTCPTNNYALWQLVPFQGQLFLGYGTNCTDNKGPTAGQLAYIDSSQTWHAVLTVPDSINSMVAAGNTMLYFGTGFEALASTLTGIETGYGPGYVYAYAGNGATNATLISGIMGDGVQCLYYLQPIPLITVSGANVIITWPTNESGFTLQSTASLSPASWSTNLPSPVVVNGQYAVTDLVSGASKSYRLSR